MAARNSDSDSVAHLPATRLHLELRRFGAPSTSRELKRDYIALGVRE
jgi:hypothetical protein